MTRDDIIRMAREAWSRDEDFWLTHEQVFLERFAALVAAAAKEEMLMAGNDQWLEEARKAEREACAKVCDEMHRNPSAEPDECAAAIRARGQA